jgi:choline transporter-like protein 2/4/5
MVALPKCPCFGSSKVQSIEDHEESSHVDAKHRKCTDIGCTIFYVIFCFVWLGVAAWTSASGDPKRLMYGSDYENMVCGSSNTKVAQKEYSTDYTDKTFVYYPRINEDLLEYAHEKDISATDVQTGTFLTKLSVDDLVNIPLTGVCVKSCPKQFDVTCSSYFTHKAFNITPTAEILTEKCYKNWEKRYASASQGKELDEMCEHCWISLMDTTKIMYRCLEVYLEDDNSKAQCIYPTPTSNDAGTVESGCLLKEETDKKETTKPAYPNPVAEFLGKSFSTIGSWIKDAGNGIVPIFVSGAVIATILGFTWIVFLRHFAPCVIWSTIVAFFTLWFVVLVFVWLKTGFLGDANFLHKALTSMGVNNATASAAANKYAQLSSGSGNSTASSSDTGSSSYAEVMPIDLHSGKSNETMWRIAAAIMTTIYVAFIFLFLFAKKKIAIAIAIIGEASKVLTKLYMLVVYPATTTLLICANPAWFIVIGAMIASATDLDPFKAMGQTMNATNTLNTTTLTRGQISVGFSTMSRALAWFHLFGYLWTDQIIMGIGLMVKAGAVCQFYWTRPEEDGTKDIGKWPIFNAWHRTLRFHFGSVVFGGAVVATVQLIRAALAYLDHHSKWMQESNKFMKIMFKVVQCLLWCFEKSIKYITGNAFIMVAMRGEPFCSSAVTAFTLMIKNVGQFMVAIFVSKVIVILGKVLIVGGSFLSCFMWLNLNTSTYGAGGSAEITNNMIPNLLTVLISYLIGSSFLHVYELCMDTLLICFLEDFKENVDAGKPELAFMPASLKRIVLGSDDHVMTRNEVEAMIEKEKTERDLKAGGKSAKDVKKDEPSKKDDKGDEAMKVTAFDSSSSDEDDLL